MSRLGSLIPFWAMAGMLLSGCASPATAVPPTQTLTPPPPPTSTAEPTAIPSPTSLPGAQVLPLDTIADTVPWLSLDKSNVPGVNYVGINTMVAPFNNALVRRALAHAVDRLVIAEMALRYGYREAVPATTLTPPQTLGRDLYGVVGAVFDPEEAKRLLTEAGYSDATAFPKALFLVNASGDRAPGARLNMAKAIAGMWRTHLGIEVEVQAIGNFAAYGERLRQDPPELWWTGWAADYNDPKNFVGELFNAGGQYRGEYNYGGFVDAEFDQLIALASSGKAETRQPLYIQAERLLCETQAAIIPLIHNLYGP